jgi:hypothetical protein
MKIWEAKPPGTLWATPGLWRDKFTFTYPELQWSFPLKLCYPTTKLLSTDKEMIPARDAMEEHAHNRGEWRAATTHTEGTGTSHSITMCYTQSLKLISLSFVPTAAKLSLVQPAVSSTAPDTPTPQRESSRGLWTVHSTKSLKTIILIFFTSSVALRLNEKPF